ncbi:hypothetical protein IV203_011492 [Nitzschia inconspicua]|uniref:Uncharacterized protein n=1 Tax=Nitzschia inconspicua TaxID=303405 RepID=A0A9K3PIX3_9STRA|nr:hypothetical protein IV203_011492 [Nitzschia inconspicua]
MDLLPLWAMDFGNRRRIPSAIPPSAPANNNQLVPKTDKTKQLVPPTNQINLINPDDVTPVFPSVLAVLVLQTSAIAVFHQPIAPLRVTANDLSPPPQVYPEPALGSLRVAVTINRSAPPDASLGSEQSPTITKTLAAIKHHPAMHHTLRPQTTSIASLKTYPTLKQSPHPFLHPLMRTSVSLSATSFLRLCPWVRVC